MLESMKSDGQSYDDLLRNIIGLDPLKRERAPMRGSKYSFINIKVGETTHEPYIRDAHGNTTNYEAIRVAIYTHEKRTGKKFKTAGSAMALKVTRIK